MRNMSNRSIRRIKGMRKNGENRTYKEGALMDEEVEEEVKKKR